MLKVPCVRASVPVCEPARSCGTLVEHHSKHTLLYAFYSVIWYSLSTPTRYQLRPKGLRGEHVRTYESGKKWCSNMWSCWVRESIFVGGQKKVGEAPWQCRAKGMHPKLEKKEFCCTKRGRRRGFQVSRGRSPLQCSAKFGITQRESLLAGPAPTPPS